MVTTQLASVLAHRLSIVAFGIYGTYMLLSGVMVAAFARYGLGRPREAGAPDRHLPWPPGFPYNVCATASNRPGYARHARVVSGRL